MVLIPLLSERHWSLMVGVSLIRPRKKLLLKAKDVVKVFVSLSNATCTCFYRSSKRLAGKSHL